MGMAFSAMDSGCNEYDYDRWMTTLAEASVRLDALQTAVSEVRHLCEQGHVDNNQILKVLAKQGL